LPRIEKQGVPKENITVWSKNGIEYFYPEDLVAAVFHCEAVDLAKCDFESDPIEFNAIRKSKKELAQLVADGLTATHTLHQEVEALLSRIRTACN